MLFDNSLNDKRFRIDIRTENGYEEGCTRGATKNAGHFGAPWVNGERRRLALRHPLR